MHLEADLHRVIAWAGGEGRRWAFSLSNAGAATRIPGKLDKLEQINWDAVAATDFRAADIKEGKQAEFLVYDLSLASGRADRRPLAGIVNRRRTRCGEPRTDQWSKSGGTGTISRGAPT